MLIHKPPRLLLLISIFAACLGLISLYSTGLPFLLQILLTLIALIITSIEILKFFQKWPFSLRFFTIPQYKLAWQLELKDGTKLEAKLLSSTRLTHAVMILHFQVLHSKMRIYQLVVPSMIGKENFHDLLLYLKTT